MSVMPITSSAKKALRVSRRKRGVNLVRKANLADVVKKFRKLISEKKMKEAQALMPALQKALDKSVKTGLIKKNTASRRKSRFSAMAKKIS